MQARLDTSLQRKFSFAFVIILLLLWLAIQINAYKIIYAAALEHTVNTYSYIINIRAKMNFAIFKDIEADLTMLSERLSPSEPPASQALKANAQYLEHSNSFIVLNDIKKSPKDLTYDEQIDKNDLAHTLTQYTNSADQYIQASFIITSYGKTYLNINNHTGKNFDNELIQDQLKKLKKAKYNKNIDYSSIQLSEVFTSTNNQHYMLISRQLFKNESALIVGFVINLQDILTTIKDKNKTELNFFSDQNNAVPFIDQKKLDSITTQELNLKLSILNPGQTFFELDNYYGIISHQSLHHCKLVTLIHKELINDIASEAFYSELNWSLTAFAIVTFFILTLFRSTFSRPLRAYVNIMNKDTESTFNRRLPEDRNDELGNFARAYNRLLDKIKINYDQLENKVQQRTLEIAKAKQLAEFSTDQKSQHLTNISHELRTPLNTIIGTIELLSNESLSKTQIELMQTASNSSKILLDIINNLLDFSRMESDQFELKLDSHSLLSVIDQSILTIQQEAQRKSIQLKTLVHGKVPETAYFDIIRVKQVLVNLLGNAVKFTNSGHIYLLLEVKNYHIYYYVKDTGCGISPEDQNSVFEPFVQLSNLGYGTGLGLAISKKLAKLMGGDLTLKSEKNKGAIFIFSLPLQTDALPISLNNAEIVAPNHLHKQIIHWKGTPILGDNPNLDEPDLSYLPYKLWQRLYKIRHGLAIANETVPKQEMLPWRLKILLVDDVESNRDILTKMLNELGQEVFCANGGRTALEMGKKQIFDLVLMDIRMPDLNGYQATEIWRTSDDILDTNCPIVALTASVFQPSDQAGLKLLNGYVTKPVTLLQLSETIEKMAAIQIDRDMQPAMNYRHDNKRTASPSKPCTEKSAEKGADKTAEPSAEKSTEHTNAKGASMPLSQSSDPKNATPTDAETKRATKRAKSALANDERHENLAKINTDQSVELGMFAQAPNPAQDLIQGSDESNATQATQNEEANALKRKLKQHFNEKTIELEKAFEQQDWQVISDVLHTVKGSAGLAGVTDIYRLAQSLEAQLKVKQRLSAEDIAELIAQLMAY